ncbi:hypothetical protein LguiB_022822 [Lonicera macranthoides]
MESISVRDFVEKKLGKFPYFLLYAILEWVIITLLLIDGFITFFCNEFAKFFELRTPCLLCTRIDHIILHRDCDIYYNDSICEDHKKDISSLAYCHVHRKLSEIRSMCEGCLISFATEKESDCDTYKSLTGVLNKDTDAFVDDDLGNNEKSNVPRCSCCGEPLKTRSSMKKIIQSSSLTNLISYSQVPTSSPRAPIVMGKIEEGRNLELPNVRYPELKFMSDNESEVQKDEDVSSADNQQSREDTKATTIPLLPDSEDSEDACKTPSLSRGNKFFGIPLTDSASSSPRWANRLNNRNMQLDKIDFSESIDINEADSDSILHRLKRQVNLDRKSLIALYMELDEERSAAAVAANNAMAMITRLQAEKAAVQMEALQYQRMMEEQAEYDEEALQVMKDMLLKREDEIKVLEADLDVYRERYGDLERIELNECFGDEYYQDFNEISDQGCPTKRDHNGGETHDESTFDFENERSYLLCMLANLEKKINCSSGEGNHTSESDSEEVECDDEDRGHDDKGILRREVYLIRERLRAIEEDSGFLKHAAMTLQRGAEGTKLLTEIAQHLRKLRHLDTADAWLI